MSNVARVAPRERDFEEDAMAARITMYSTPWCGYCRRLKGQLQRAGIAYDEVDIEQNPTAAEYVMSVNGGNQTVPTVTFPDGSALTNPSLAQVMDKLEAAV
jgi:mycoredoxin